MTGSYVWLRTTANQVVQWKIRLQVQVIWWKIDQEGPSKGAWTNNQQRQKIQCLGKLWQHWMCWDNQTSTVLAVKTDVQVYAEYVANELRDIGG
jgi:hypothetical protein